MQSPSIKVPLYRDKNKLFNGFNNDTWGKYTDNDYSVTDPIDTKHIDFINSVGTNKFYYPVYLSHWLFPYDVDVKDRKLLWDSFFIPIDIVKSIKDGKCKLLIHNTLEGWNLGYLDNTVYETILKKYDLDFSNVIYLTGNLVRQSPNGVINIYHNRFEDIYLFYNKHKINFKELSLKKIKNNENLKYKFLCLNRRPSAQRLALYEFINNKQYGLVSQAVDIANNDNIDFAIKEFAEKFPKIYKRFNKKNLSKTLPAVIDYEDMTFNNPTHDIKLRKYYESYLHIVSETFYTDKSDRMFFSEKIIKPIFFMRPFILFGQANSLKYLKSLGYKTFDSFIDESYDEIKNYNKRFLATCNSIDKFISRDFEDIKKDLNSMIPILEHNYNNLEKRNKDLSLLVNQLLTNL